MRAPRARRAKAPSSRLRRLVHRPSLLAVVPLAILVLFGGVGATELVPEASATSSSSAWSITSQPAALGFSSLDAVSCSSKSNCIGLESDQYEAQSLLDENGDFSTAPLAEPGGGLELNSLSCPTDRFCAAVGTLVEDESGPVLSSSAIIETFNGTSWSVSPNPLSQDPSSGLEKVSCASATMCAAIGTASAGAVIETFNGTSWSLSNEPSFSELDAISCATTTSCVAVGLGSNNQLGSVVLAGGSWSDVAMPDPGAATPLSLSCADASLCLAVGYLETNGTTTPMSEIFSGSSWTVLLPPSVPSSGSSASAGAVLTGVSCTKDKDCVAVGNTGPADAAGLGVASTAFAASFDGGSWTSAQPIDATADASLETVSCVPGASGPVCLSGGYVEQVGAPVALVATGLS